MAENFKIFISYRRKGGHGTARLIYERLKRDGYSVFFDTDILENGNFDSELEKRVKKCKDFILILSPDIFERFSGKGYDAKSDWVRQEIVTALETNKNIVPLALDDFEFPRNLPDDIKDISRKNSVQLSQEHFDSSYDKIKDFLISKPNWKVRSEKGVRYFITFIFIALFASLLFGVYFFQKKHLETQAALKVAEDTIKIIRMENELKIIHMVDSIKMAEQTVADSVKKIMTDEMTFKIDSIKKSIEESKTKPAPLPPKKKVVKK